MTLISRLAATTARVIRDVAQAPRVAAELRRRRATSEDTAGPRIIEPDIDADNAPDTEDIILAAKEHEQARIDANAAARQRRRADRVLKRTPNGTYGPVTIERTENPRSTADLDAIRAIFLAHNLGEVPMKPCAPSLRITFTAEQSLEGTTTLMTAA